MGHKVGGYILEGLELTSALEEVNLDWNFLDTITKKRHLRKAGILKLFVKLYTSPALEYFQVLWVKLIWGRV